VSAVAQTGVPIPPSRSTLPGRKRNPDTMAGRIRALKVGESLYFDKRQNIVCGTALAQKLHGRVDASFEFVTRKEGDGARIWRTK
jgi:hypothetical protein